MKKMSKKERIDMTLAGQPADRIPVSFWRHFYEHEDTPRGLSDAMIKFQEDYDWDFMKVNPRASYHHEDWGVQYKFFKDGFKKPQRVSYSLKKISHLKDIKPLNPLKAPVLRDHLDSLHYISKALQGKTYFLMTVFTPLSIAADMAESRDVFYQYMQEEPQLVLDAVEAITETYEKFVEEALNTGISGLFYATTYWGSYDRLSSEEFDKFSKPFDKRILQLVQNSPFNILHVCKSNNMLAELKDYPVHAFNWDASDPSNIKLDEGKELLGKTVIGGIDHQKTLSEGSSQDCIKEAEHALSRLGQNGWMLGAGCTYSPEAPSSNLKALRRWVEQITPS